MIIVSNYMRCKMNPVPDKDKAKEKKLKHVKVYDKLYEQIQAGTYPVGSQLPSETTLASQMNVSRMTLRKALALLQDDGLTKNVQGVGHFVRAHSEEETPTESISNTLTHPVYSFCTETLDSVEMEFRIEPPTKAISDSLKRYTPAVVIVDRWYKHEGTPLAYTLSMLPIELIGEKHIDLNKEEHLLRFLETTCYEDVVYCKQTCMHSTAGNFSATTYTLSEHNSFLLIHENIYDAEHKVLVFNKHFIPSDLFKIELKYGKA